MPDLRWFMLNWDYYYFGDKPPHISWVELDQTSINLDTPWQTVQLTATVLPQDTIDSYTLTWSSSDTSVATVSQTWLVTCITPWDATITVTTTPWNFTATCSVISWILLDETNFKNSSYSKNWYFNPKWWANATSFSATGYDTANWRIYSTGNHSFSSLAFSSSAYNVMGNAKMLKIVYDYLLIANNTNRYGSWIKLPRVLIAKKSSWWQYEVRLNLNYTPVYTSAINWGVEYSWELIYDLEADTWTMTFTNLSDNTQSVVTMSWVKQYWTTSTLFSDTRSANPWFWGVYKDQGTTSYCGEMHVYYMW